MPYQSSWGWCHDQSTRVCLPVTIAEAFVATENNISFMLISHTDLPPPAPSALTWILGSSGQVSASSVPGGSETPREGAARLRPESRRSWICKALREEVCSMGGYAAVWGNADQCMRRRPASLKGRYGRGLGVLTIDQETPTWAVVSSARRLELRPECRRITAACFDEDGGAAPPAPS